MSPAERITVFVADGCEACAALLADLRRRGVRFEEVNLSAQPGRLDELPVVVDHERVSIGYAGASSSFADLGLDD